ncbi:MAG: dynamin family protein [Candidatus Jordarchaeaceae archaeon]
MGMELIDLRKKVNEISEYHNIVLDTLRQLRNHRNAQEFVELMEDMQQYREQLEKAYEDILHSFNEEVYIGIVGRYSHGKTALVNAIFGLNGDDELPVGEGVVTSKICNIGFTKHLGGKVVKIVYENGQEQNIDFYTSKQLIKGINISDIDEALIAYINFDLPEVSANTFTRQMAEKNIRLIDMPGLGGKYFLDTELTKKYIGACDALLIIIKATEIEQAGRVLNDVLTSRKPKIVIPVVTFYDLTNSSPKFVGLDDDQKQNLIKKEISENIPYLNYFIDQVIFVSSKTGLNIDELRKYIYNKLFGVTITAIKGIEDSINPVFQRKSEDFLKSVSFYTSIIKNIREKIERNVQKLEESEVIPIESDLEDEFDEILNEIDAFCVRVIQKTLYEAKGRIELLRYVETLSEFQDLRRKAILDVKSYSTANVMAFQKELERIVEKRIRKIIIMVKKVLKAEELHEQILKELDGIRSKFHYQVDLYFLEIESRLEKELPNLNGSDLVPIVMVPVISKLLKFLDLGIFSKEREAKIHLKEKANEAYQRLLALEKELSAELFKVLRQIVDEYFDNIREIVYEKRDELTDRIKLFHQILRDLNKHLKDLEKVSSEVIQKR